MYMAKKNLHVAGLSVAAGGAVTVVVLVVGAILDKFMNAKMSNIAALVIGMFINFFLQQLIFVEGHLTETTSQMSRYAVADVVILGSNQWLFTYLVHHEDEYKKYLPDALQDDYNTVCRFAVGSLIWLLFSFPLRKFWVFVPKNKRK
jgi:putative flippase GtrA